MPGASFYGAVAVAAVFFYYAGTSEVAWLYLLAYWIAALIVASFLYQLWNRGFRGEIFVRGYKFAAGVPQGALPGGGLSRGPRGPARMTGSVAGVELAIAAGLVSKKGWTEQKVVGPVRRGPVSPTGWRLYAGDLLGLYSDDLGNRTEGESELVLVLPRFASLGSRHRVRELEASAAGSRAGTGTELFGVREYRPGDPLRRIHWRSSARHGELIVREYEPPGVQTLGIFCDPNPSNPEVADQVARIAASEAWDCVRNGGRVMLWGPGLASSESREGHLFWAALEWRGRVPGEGES